VRALCVARHRFLSEHLASWFGALDIECTAAVGLDGALVEAATTRPDVVLCEYDLLAVGSLEAWERDPELGRTPVIAVSLTRRPNEMHLLDVNGIAGFLYLPTLAPDDARRLLAAARRPVAPPPSFSLPATLEWTRTTTTAR
jgi:DNA-binding NarL/FixJ family response regulator